MRFPKLVVREAQRNAQALFYEHQFDQAIRKEPERIRSLAQFEANYFYQNGFILLFLKAAWLGEEYEVKNLYTQTFIKTYQAAITQATSL